MRKAWIYRALMTASIASGALLLYRIERDLILSLLVLGAFGTSYILSPLIGRLAHHFGVIDKPGGRKIHEKPTPLLGGVAIYTAFVLCAVFGRAWSLPWTGVFLTVTIIFLLGVAEDAKGVPAILRLAVQAIAVGVLIKTGVVLTFLPPSWWGLVGEWALTFLWVVGMTNAFNFLDGLDGLATGSAAVNAFFFGVYATATGQSELALLSLLLMAAALGFLPHNYKPGRNRAGADIFLGDSGSTFLGCTLASLAILGDWAEGSPKDLIVPVLIMAVPIFDMVLITVMRFREGLVHNLVEWIIYAGRDHFHHRLLGLGIRKKEAVAIIYLVNFCLGISAFLLKGASTTDAFLVLVQVTILFGIIGYAIVVMRKRRIGRGITASDADEVREEIPAPGDVLEKVGRQ